MSSKIEYDGKINGALSVRDLGTAVRWYQETLGFEVLMQAEEMGWAELTSPSKDVTLGLSQVEEVPTGGGATIVFGVKDVDAARGRLEANGVRFDGETQTVPDMVKLATFFDPDGNTFMFAQDLSG